MKGIVVVDANLLILFVVGLASRDFISKHGSLNDYTEADFARLAQKLSEYDELVLLPHVLAEVSNLLKHISHPAKRQVYRKFRAIIEDYTEMQIPSLHGARREEMIELGLTDAVLLHLCTLDIDGIRPTLITADRRLADVVHSLGLSDIYLVGSRKPTI